MIHQQPPTTLFHITHYKAGSQWVYMFLRELFPDRIVHPLKGIAHVPQVPQAGRIYPTVYLSKSRFAAIQTPEHSKCVFVLRDLRDAHISRYFSTLKSHPLEAVTGNYPGIAKHREKLNQVDLHKGLLMMLPILQVDAEIQQSWYGSSDVLTVRYEDFLKDEFGCFRRILEFANLKVDQAHFEAVVKKHSFTSITGRKRGDEDQNSHFRKGIEGDWRNYYDQKLKKHFKQMYGDVLITTGYETNHDW